MNTPTMNKKQLYEAMGGQISMTVIGKYSEEYQIIGKYGLVSWMGDCWDIWITGIHREKELSQRKVNSLTSRIKTCVKCDFNELTREAYTTVATHEEACRIALILGARKKRKCSPKSLENLRPRAFGQGGRVAA